jgi:hypothetical protein
MLDIFNIPAQQDNVKIFYAGAGTNDWQTWTRPRGCKFVYIMCIGGAAGGYSGQGTVTTDGTQGIAGGSAAVTRVLFTANVLPDTLFIQPGVGGAGATGTTGTSVASGAGNRSYVSIYPTSSAAMNLVCASGLAAANGANGETAVTTVAAGLLSLGTFQSIAGILGTIGSPTTLGSSIITAGAGGGGITTSVASAGFSIASVNGTTFVTPAIPGGAVTGANGANGIWSWKPFYGVGGAGGGANLSGLGGKGGDGAYGCGGGGGGAASTTGGSGGKGGDGLVIIATF